jgi:hypothetical protein
MARTGGTVQNQVYWHRLVLLAAGHFFLMTIRIQCTCGNRREVHEPSLDVRNNELERKIVEMQLVKQKPCSCGKNDWRLLDWNEK